MRPLAINHTHTSHHKVGLSEISVTAYIFHTSQTALLDLEVKFMNKRVIKLVAELQTSWRRMA